MNLKYRVLIQWSDEDNCYLVSLPDFPDTQQWVTHGETYQEALEKAIEVMEDLIGIYQEQGKPAPEPQSVSKLLAG